MTVVERLVPHPRLPLVAGLDAERPAVHIWELDDGDLREAGTVGADRAPYGDASGWDRHQQTPVVAWHPARPLLLVAGGAEVLRWTPAGVSAAAEVPDDRYLAFSPDGETLWASSSGVIDLASGTVDAGPTWDTGVAEHPGGGLVMTLNSEQGGTFGVFARVEGDRMRVLRRALILDCDGYETPLFSADGRHLAIRGNAYGNVVEVFELPSLTRVLATTLGTPSPGYPYPQEWLDEVDSWSRHNLAFAGGPGVLWIGKPDGTLVELDIVKETVVAHEVLTGPVTALTALATGELVVAGGGGELLIRPLPAGDPDGAAAVAAAFLESTSELPADGTLWTDALMTDGTSTWEAGDLETVTEAAETDPTWLRIQAAVNSVRG